MSIRPGEYVTTLVRVATDPPMMRGLRCKVVAVSSDNQKLFLEGPGGVVFSLPRGDVFRCR